MGCCVDNSLSDWSFDESRMRGTYIGTYYLMVRCQGENEVPLLRTMYHNLCTAPNTGTTVVTMEYASTDQHTEYSAPNLVSQKKSAVDSVSRVNSRAPSWSWGKLDCPIQAAYHSRSPFGRAKLATVVSASMSSPPLRRCWLAPCLSVA